MEKTDIDALVVFFGDFDEQCELSAESERRLAAALALYRQGMGKNIIFAGGWRPVQNICGSRVMAERAVKAGVRKEHVFYDRISRDTVGNWKESEKIMRANNFSSALLVSSFFHLARVRYLLKPVKGIKAFYVPYRESGTEPVKTMGESFSEYNYNMISAAAYIILPSELYQNLIEKLRK